MGPSRQPFRNLPEPSREGYSVKPSRLPHPLGWEGFAGRVQEGLRGGEPFPSFGPLTAPPCELPPPWFLGAVLALVVGLVGALLWAVLRQRATLRTLSRAARRGHGRAVLRLLGADTSQRTGPKRGAKPKPSDDDEPPTSAPPASCARSIGRKGPRSAVLPRWRRFDPADVPMGAPGLVGAP